MNTERRRYFRINETVGVGFDLLDHHHHTAAQPLIEEEERIGGILDQVEDQDARIEQLLVELEDDHPGVVELISLFNQKLERVVNHLLLDSQLVRRIAHKVRVVNISACGIAFESDEEIASGSHLQLHLTLYPDKRQLETRARVVDCEKHEAKYYWRVDFVSMSKADQEVLIQHIVRSQSSQLKHTR